MAHLDNSSDFQISFALAPNEAHLIPDSVIQRASETIAAQLLNGTAITLLTSINREGKTHFLKSLLRGLKSDLRSIYLDSSDLYQPSATDEESRIRGSKQSFQTMFSYLRESVRLGEQLVIVIDNADELPSQIFEECITPLLVTEQKVSFLLAGLPSLIALTQYAMGIQKFGVALCSLDELSVKELKEFIDFQQLPADPSDKYTFEETALREVATQASGSLLKASVLLEWCRVYLTDQPKKNITKATVASVSALLLEKSKTENKNYFTHYPESKDRLEAFEETIVLPPDDNQPILDSLDLEETQTTPQSLYFDLDHEKVREEKTASETSPLKNKPIQTEPIQSGPARSEQGQQDTIKRAPPAPTLTTVSAPPEPPAVRRWPLVLFVFAFAAAYYWIYTQTQQHPLQGQTQTADQEQRIATVADTNLNAKKNEDQGITPNEASPPRANSSEKSASNDLSNIKNREPQQNLETLASPSQNTNPQPTAEPDEGSLSTLADAPMLQQLLSLAEAQYADKKLTTPENDNAFNTYQIILRLSPNHPDAITGLGQIKQRYLRWAGFELAQNRKDRARLFYERALLIDPNDSEIKQNLADLQ